MSRSHSSSSAKRRTGRRKEDKAPPPPPTVVQVGFSDEAILTAWSTRTWVCIIPEAYAGGFYLVQNIRKKFWDGFGARMAEQQPPWADKEARVEAMDSNIRAAAKTLVLQSRGLLATSIEDAEQLLQDGFLETVGNDVLVCTIGVREVDEEALLKTFCESFSKPIEMLPECVARTHEEECDDEESATTKPKQDVFNFEHMRIVDTTFAVKSPHQIHAVARTSILSQ